MTDEASFWFERSKVHRRCQFAGPTKPSICSPTMPKAQKKKFRRSDSGTSCASPVILEKVRVYVESMAKGRLCKDDLEVKKVAPKASSAAATTSSAAAKAPVPAKKEEVKEKKGFKRIKLTEKFSCREINIYEILMDENRWKDFTQSNAKISKQVGGEFNIFDGSVTGTNEELQEGKLIVQKWRFGSWPDGVYSTVKLTFEEPEPGVTIIKLIQTNVPEEDRYGNETVAENTERGWRDLIFHKIRAIFGFGL